MPLVPDNFAANLNPTPKMFTVSTVCSGTPNTSGVAVTDAVNVFLKNAPFAMEVINIFAVTRVITLADFNGTGGSVTISADVSQEVDISPAAPTTIVWDTLVAPVECKLDAVNLQCVQVPGPATLKGEMDQSFVLVPKGGSLRVTLSAQVEDAHAGADSPVEIMVTVKGRPTELKEKRYF